MDRLKATGIIGVSTLSVLLVGPAEAALLGDTVNCSINPSTQWSCSQPSALVDGTVEFQLDFEVNVGPPIGIISSTQFDIDISSESILLTYINTGATTITTQGLILSLSDLDWVNDPSGRIVGVDVFLTGTDGVEASDITFGDDFIDFNLTGTSWNSDNSPSVRIDLQVEHVPEPLTSLGAIIAAGAGVALKRRRKTA